MHARTNVCASADTQANALTSVDCSPGQCGGQRQSRCGAACGARARARVCVCVCVRACVCAVVVVGGGGGGRRAAAGGRQDGAWPRLPPRVGALHTEPQWGGPVHTRRSRGRLTVTCRKSRHTVPFDNLDWNAVAVMLPGARPCLQAPKGPRNRAMFLAQQLGGRLTHSTRATRAPHDTHLRRAQAQAMHRLTLTCTM